MSDHNFTSSEVREVLMEMGKAVGNEEELMYLTREVNLELPPSDHSNPDDYDLEDIIANDSIFASLSIDPEKRFKQNQDGKNLYDSPKSSDNAFEDYACSPIVNRRKKGGYEAVRYPESVTSPNFGQEASSLVRQAYESIHRAYRTCQSVGKVSKMMEEHTKYLKGSQENGGEEEYLEDEEFENQYDEEIEVLESEDPSKSRKSSAQVIMDPCYRPVLNPKPGKAPFKCDPVTRFHLYKEEWERHPAPGEERRLALRWKLRDKLLHHEIPNIQHPFRKAEHPKDWSPKPYLD